jgi:hypothetical protein
VRNILTFVPGKKEKLPLSVTHPELAKEADGWDPNSLTAGSGKKVTWRCAKKHTWDSVVYSRTGTVPGGCPYCSGQRVLTGYNDLLTRFPDIANEAYEWDPAIVNPGSEKKFNWKCPIGHIYEASPGNRTRSRTHCPICSGNKVLSGFNDLATTHPELAQEAQGWDPTLVSRGSTIKRNWKCKKSHNWSASPNARTRKGQGTNCPYCANQRLLIGFNDLATTNPELALQAYGWDPMEVVAGSSKKMNWKCEKGHQWQATINSRDKMNLGCPYCSNKKVLVGFNDLASAYPELAAEADGWDPSSFSSGSSSHKSWKCAVGHTWKTAISYRSKRGWGCPYCSNQRLLIGFNDLRTTHPEISLEAVGWDPSLVTSGSLLKMKWKCPLGHQYESIVRDRAQRSTDCVVCAGRAIVIGFNDLASTHPQIAAQASGWDPTKFTAGSNTKLNWQCELGHEWISVVTNRIRLNSGCPYCKNKTLLQGFNDLETLRPELALEADGWNPRAVIVGSGKKLKWKCVEGHSWRALVVSRTSGHESGCPSCAKTGFDPNLDGYLYFLFHPDWEMLQIGITNVPDIRLAKHKNKGWEVLEVRGPMEGDVTRSWETSILRMLKAKGADLSNEIIAGKFDGYSEAWSKSTFEAKSIKELMRLTEEFELSGNSN